MTAVGDYDRLGLTDSEAGEYLYNWFTFYELKNGEESLSDFDKFFCESIIIENLINDIMIYRKNTKVVSNFIIFRLFAISKFLFSTKNQATIFNQIFIDWQEEYFEALSEKEIWKARLINVRYTYAFILSMLQMSPIGDLFELLKVVLKIAK